MEDRETSTQPKIVSFVNPVYYDLVDRVNGEFSSKMDELRRGGENAGKYLVGSSISPFRDVSFKVVESEAAFTDIPRGENEILMGEKI